MKLTNSILRKKNERESQMYIRVKDGKLEKKKEINYRKYKQHISIA